MNKANIYKDSVIHFICSYIVIGSVLLALFWHIGLENYILVFMLLSITVHIVIGIFMYPLEYYIIQFFIKPYLILCSISIYFLIILFCNYTPLSLIWYVIFPTAAYHFFSTRYAIYWSIYIAFIILITFLMNYWFELPNLSLAKSDLFIINLITILSVIYFICFFLYYKNKIIHVTIDDLTLKSSIILENELNSNEIYDPQGNYKKIYQDIITLFENDDVYLDSNFNISKLAELLDTNISYVSRTLNSIAGSNFNTFLNKYRIEYIKKLMQESEYDRYNMTYFYTQTGFKTQSTFNKVFKDLEGITPTEYIKTLNK